MMKWKLLLALLLVLAVPALAQYGTGLIYDVKQAAGPLKLTAADSNAWKSVPAINMANRWDGAWSGHPTADVTAMAKVMYVKDTLYVYARIDDFEPFYWGPAGKTEPWKGEQILIGVDATHHGDTTAVDGSWGGWTKNAPGKGPVAYKVTKTGVTLNWGGAKNAQDSGFVRANVFVDTVNFVWGVYAAIYVPGLNTGSKIGFNIGGANADKAWADKDTANHDGSYAYYSWQAVDYPGGDVMYNAKSFSTLNATTTPSYYGANFSRDVAKASSTPKLTAADSTMWKNVPAINIANRWDGAWSGHPTADVTSIAKLLWAKDTLYVYARIDDFEPFYWGPAGKFEPWKGEQILIGVDATHHGDTTAVDGSWGGWTKNAPGKGPVTYKVTKTGVTLNWGGAKNAQDSGFVRANVFVDTVNFVWGVYAAIYVPGINTGSKIGFNIGGANADKAWADKDTANHDGSYAYYSFSAVDYPGGDVMYNAMSFFTLNMATTTGVKEIAGAIPAAYQLNQNYPNPFNPTTNIRFALPHSGNVTLTVYNVLGEEVAKLVDGVQNAGIHEVNWNARNVSSGMYFYQLKVDGRAVETRKMVLMK